MSTTILINKLAVKLTDSIFRWDHNIELLIKIADKFKPYFNDLQ